MSPSKTHTVRFVVAGVAGLVLGVAVAEAEEIVLTPLIDTSIYEEFTGNSNGVGPHLYSGQTAAGNLRRALIKFDVNAIPSDATVTDVTLTLVMNQGVPTETTHTLNPVTASWGEAGSNGGEPGGTGAPAEMGDATWEFRFFAVDMWTTAGGDFGAPSATLAIQGTGTYVFSGQGMIDDVQGWVTGSLPNHGWAFLGDEGMVQSAKRFASSENLDTDARPMLTVTYTPLTPTVTRSWSEVKAHYAD